LNRPLAEYDLQNLGRFLIPRLLIFILIAKIFIEKLTYDTSTYPRHRFNLFLILALFNLFGLNTYGLSLNSLPLFSILLGLTFWLSFNWRSSYTLRFKKDLVAYKNLAILGLNPLLSVILALLEALRLVITAITLLVRLTANVLVGHILLTLASRLPLVSASIIALWLLYGLEGLIRLVQAYVFVLLLLTYQRANRESPQAIRLKYLESK